MVVFTILKGGEMDVKLSLASIASVGVGMFAENHLLGLMVFFIVYYAIPKKKD